MPLIDPADAPREAGNHERLGGYERLHLGAAGGIGQFGVVLEMLPPGAASSDRHWHEAEDEFLWVLEGEATVVEDSGERPLQPGDCMAWPAGVPNAHRVENRCDTPLRFLVAGWRSLRDVVHYPDRGVRAVVQGDERREEPASYAQASGVTSGYIDRAACPMKTGSIYPAPYGAMMAGRSSLRLGQAGGLSQFGANLVLLEPGAKSSLRHWHEHEDEFAMVVKGTPTLVENDGPHPTAPGSFAGFPAGVENGHHFINDSDSLAGFLVLGSRMNPERAFYSDIDLAVALKDGGATFTTHNGLPYEEPVA